MSTRRICRPTKTAAERSVQRAPSRRSTARRLRQCTRCTVTEEPEWRRIARTRDAHILADIRRADRRAERGADCRQGALRRIASAGLGWPAAFPGLPAGLP